MDKTGKPYSQIKKYLSGELTSEELNEFENELENNVDLKETIEIHFELDQAILENDIIDFRKYLKELTKNEIPQKEKKSVGLYLRVAIVTVIFLLVGVLIYNFTFENDNHSQLYEAYYTPYENLISSRSTNSDKHISIMMKHYDNHEYSEVIKKLSAMEINDKPLLQLYLGISYLNLNQVTQAHILFEGLSDGNNTLKEDAMWYNALTYLKEGNTNQSKIILKKIISQHNASNYDAAALELLSRL